MSRATRVLSAALLGASLACGDYGPIEEPQPEASIDAQLREQFGTWGIVPIGPLPPVDSAMIRLGQALMFDRILSGNRDVSCATCHDPSAALHDGFSLAIGTGATMAAGVRTLGPGRAFAARSAPTLINQGLRAYQLFWDGRISGFASGPFQTPLGAQMPSGLPDIVAAQAMFPVLNRQEMRGSAGDLDVHGNANELALIPDDQPQQVWSAVMARVFAIPAYDAMFRVAFPGVVAFDFRHAATAIGAFETSAYTRTNSPFDRYLARDDQAMTLAEKRGALLFFGQRARCSSCHNGPLLGGNDFANVGAPQIGPGTGTGAPIDLGRGGLPEFANGGYRFAFRVPPLRNVELTAPYFHDGAYATLDAVVKHYNGVELAIRNYDPAQLSPAFRSMYHGDAATIDDVVQHLDGRLRQPLGLSDAERTDIVAFLRALTDPTARDLNAVVPASVPSGLPVR